MSKRDKIIALSIAGLLILIVVSVIIKPIEGFAYEGNGEVYGEDVEEKDSNNSSGDSIKDIPVVGEVDEAIGSVDEALGKMLGASEEIFSTKDYDEISKDYQTPEVVNRINKHATKMTIVTADSFSRLYVGLSGLYIIHGALAVLYTGYYDFWKDKKYNFMSRTVESTRNKFGGNTGGSTSTTTTNKDGSVTSNVVNTAKKMTGPATMLISFLVNSVVEIAVIVAMFILIRNGFIIELLDTVLKLGVKIVQWIVGMLRGVAEGGI